MTPFPIHFDVPVCTVARFAELTGMSKGTVEDRVRAGRIPIMPKMSPAETVLINLVLYTQQALAQGQTVAKPKARPVTRSAARPLNSVAR